MSPLLSMPIYWTHIGHPCRNASTISRMESTGQRPVRGQAGTVDAVVRALEASGVVIEHDGVRLRKPRR